MKDLAIELADRPGALAELGRVLGAAGVSVQGGGVFTNRGRGLAHFLVGDADAEPAGAALAGAEITLLGTRPVLLQRLRQDVPGQLGKICRQMSDAGVNIEVMYSDHDNQLVLVVDDHATGQRVSVEWTAAASSPEPRAAAPTGSRRSPRSAG